MYKGALFCESIYGRAAPPPEAKITKRQPVPSNLQANTFESYRESQFTPTNPLDISLPADIRFNCMQAATVDSNIFTA
jgi:hypothetical protein